MYPSFEINGKIAVITGASMGIGYGLAKALAHAGATVVATARNMGKLEQLCEEIRQEGGKDLKQTPTITILLPESFFLLVTCIFLR